jgi:ribonuclease E
MSANQRRSGFRLPWLSESDEPDESAPRAEENPAAPGADAESAPAGATPTSPPAAPATNGARSAQEPSGGQETAAEPPVPAAAAAPTPAETPGPSSAAPAPAPGPTTEAETTSDFLRDLVTAMRTVADDARKSEIEKLRTRVDEAVRSLEAGAEPRREELRGRAEADIAVVGEWARAEAERIAQEAEQRVAARREQLEQELAAETTRIDAEAKALRTRVDDYERELEGFAAQLAGIGDPAAFAAAAKRMPAPPRLTPPPGGVPDSGAAEAPSTAAKAEHEEPSGEAPADEVHPAEEEVLTARLAELDEKLEEAPATPAAEPAAAAASSGPVTTDIVVKGLGSFGAITGFRQSLSGQPGISTVALSLGQSGEFVFRATHAPGFDVAEAITKMEGGGATVEPRSEGGLRVTLEQSR